MKLNLTNKRTWATIMLYLSYSGISAASTVFTWDLSKSVPALGASGSTITADTIDVTTYLRAVVQSNGNAAFNQILQITGFELNGHPVAAPGLNSSYGLYFAINGSNQFSTYTSLNISLMADPGDNDGTLSATVSGFGFSNGTAGDFVLGSGTLLAASLALDASGVRHANYVETFASAPGEAGFFGITSPGLQALLTTPAANFAALPQPDGITIDLVNGGIGQVTFTPEPATMTLLGAGLVALLLTRRRKISGHKPNPFIFAPFSVPNTRHALPD